MEFNEFKIKIQEKSEKINIAIDDKQAEKFYDYMNLLIQWNEKINLTAIIEENDIILKHFIDCFTINNYIKDNETIMDIGTGAGFPGLPISILNQKNKVILIDSLNKRINFLNEVVEKLNLKNVTTYHGRAEEVSNKIEYRQQGDLIVSRAVAKLNVLLEYTMPFVKIGGKCICMKGPNIEEELIEAKKAIEILGGELIEVKNIILPDSDMQRNIIVIKKIKETPSKYPRKAGIPNKEPIM